MAENNAGDILTTDWNPLVGCQRYSPGCKDCWWLDGIMPWQIRLGNLPHTLKEGAPLVIEDRLSTKKLRPKKGIVGVIQHGDVFWDKVADKDISRILDVVDEVALEREEKNKKRASKGEPLDATRYVLWSKRAERMATFITARYGETVPDYLACGVSIENQKLANERLPHLQRINGHRFVMIEPMLGPIDLTGFENVSWVVLGSETGGNARPMDLDWARKVRDFAKHNNLPFFLKQVGTSHKSPTRELDGQTWDEFPEGFVKKHPYQR
jgi:protein gp37